MAQRKYLPHHTEFLQITAKMYKFEQNICNSTPDALVLCFFCTYILNINSQYISQNMHMVLSCFALLQSCYYWISVFSESCDRPLSVDIFCWGSRAPTIWTSKGPKQNLKDPSIEIHHQFSNFGCSIGPSGKFHKGPIGFSGARGGPYLQAWALCDLFSHVPLGCLAGTGAILWLPQCQSSNPEEHG